MSTKKEKIITIISTIVAFFVHLLLIITMYDYLNSINFLFFIIICMTITALFAFFIPAYKSYKVRTIRTIAITLFIVTLTVNLFYINLLTSLSSFDSGSPNLFFLFVGRHILPEKLISCTIGMTITTLIAFFIPAHKSKKFRIIKIIAITLFIATSLICLFDIWKLYISVQDFLSK